MRWQLERVSVKLESEISKLERANHIIFTCAYATRVWGHLSTLTGTQMLLQGGNTVQETWDASWEMVRIKGGVFRKEWASRFMYQAWFLWQQRNEKVFRGEVMPSIQVAKRI